jgi:hypothetical protein
MARRSTRSCCAAVLGLLAVLPTACRDGSDSLVDGGDAGPPSAFHWPPTVSPVPLPLRDSDAGHAADAGGMGSRDAATYDGSGEPTVLFVNVTDGVGGLSMPARLLLYDENDVLLRIGWLDGDPVQDQGFCEVAPGAIGTWTGIALTYGVAEIPIGAEICDGRPAVPYGRYRARVLRDTQHEMFETWLDLGEGRGRVQLDAPLARAFAFEGWLAADMHVHALNSGDSMLPRDVRVVTMAAAGIQVIGSTDHNYNADYTAEIASLGLGSFVASIPGNEISVGIGHFNVWPVEVDPSQPRGGAADYGALSAGDLFAAAHALPGQPLLQVNHARLGWAAYFDYAGWDGLSWPPPMPVDFDALEVLSGFLAYDTSDDPRLTRAVQDFYTLWRNGVEVTALGNSDTHHLNYILAGFPRTYVRVPDARTEPFDEASFVQALREGHTVATTGPFLDVRVEGTAGPGDVATAADGTVLLEVRLRQPTYVHATRLRVWVGGTMRRTIDIPLGTTALDWSSREAVGPADTWIGVDAAGDDPLPWELPGDYLFLNALGGMLPFAIISPVRIDADGDGSYGPATEPLKNVPDLLPPPPGPDGLPPVWDCPDMLMR